MRFLLMLAVVVSASLAIAQELSSDPPREAESQGPIPASPFATESPATAPEVAGEARTAFQARPQNAPVAENKLKVGVFIEKNSFTICFNVNTPTKSRGGESLSTYIICNKAIATGSGSDTDPSTVICTNCKVMLPDGNRGTANEASYDSITDTLTLRGTKDKPVKLTMGNGQRTMTATEIAIGLNTAAPDTTPTITPGVLPGELQGQPNLQGDDDLFGSPIKPQPAAQDENPFSGF